MKEKEVAAGLGGVLHKMIVKALLPHLLYSLINVSLKHLIYKFFLYNLHCCLCYVRTGNWAKGAFIFIFILNGFLEFSTYNVQGPK